MIIVFRMERAAGIDTTFALLPTLPIFPSCLVFAFLKVTFRACIHLNNDKVLSLCIFSEEGQNGSRDKGSDYFFLHFLLGKKQTSQPPLQQRSCKWLKFG